MKKGLISKVIPRRIPTGNGSISFLLIVHKNFSIGLNRDYDGKSCFSRLWIDLYASPMRLYKIIAQTQTQSRSLPGWLGVEERLEDFVFDGVGDTGAVVRDRDLYPIPFATLSP